MSYYASKKSRFLRDFDMTANLMQDYLVQRYGEELAGTLYRETRQEYEELITSRAVMDDFSRRILSWQLTLETVLARTQ